MDDAGGKRARMDIRDTVRIYTLAVELSMELANAPRDKYRTFSTVRGYVVPYSFGLISLGEALNAAQRPPLGEHASRVTSVIFSIDSFRGRVRA